MSLNIKESTQFKIEELIVVTKTGAKIDISAIYEEIEIYDSLFMPVMSGKILLRDALGLSNQLVFDGSEALLIHISKDPNSKQPNLDFKKSFRIYKQSDRSNTNMNSEMYVLNFVADELIYSDQRRVNQAYELTYTGIVLGIMSEYLKLSGNNFNGIYDATKGIRKVVIPNLRPLEAIEWCSKRSVDEKNSPNFMFYQNVTGYNYASLSNLLTLPSVMRIKFEPKNMKLQDAEDEMFSARSMDIVSQTNIVDKTRSGVLAGTFIGFDTVTSTIMNKPITYMDHYGSMEHGNENPNLSVIPNRDNINNTEEFFSRKTVSTYSTARKKSNYIKKYEPESIPLLDNMEDFVFQRKAILKNLMERRIRFSMPGNFQLSSGFNVDVLISVMGEKVKGAMNDDMTLTGKYLIVGAKHIIGYEKHETVIEVATTSTANDDKLSGISQQTTEILEY